LVRVVGKQSNREVFMMLSAATDKTENVTARTAGGTRDAVPMPAATGDNPLLAVRLVR
jgi:hypothetical protein